MSPQTTTIGPSSFWRPFSVVTLQNDNRHNTSARAHKFFPIPNMRPLAYVMPPIGGRGVRGVLPPALVPHVIHVHCLYGPHPSPLNTASQSGLRFCSTRLRDRGQTDDRPRHGTSVGIGRILHYVQAMRPKIMSTAELRQIPMKI